MGLNLNAVLTWYQGKIGRYDKEDWEETVEHRILHGLSNIPKKSAKLRHEFIDVDFIRGTSFPKPKSKHGVGTVLRLACLRLLFLPVYKSWWSRHTNPRAFWFLALLYSLQMGSMGIYFLIYGNAMDGSNKPYFEDVSSVEVTIPGIMMFVLTFILCQIVAGHSPSPRSCRRSRGKRARRHKKRSQSEARRGLTSVGGSKSSLENTDGYYAENTRSCEQTSPKKRKKIRSFSEDRARIPRLSRRSHRTGSLNLEPGMFDRARKVFNNHNFLGWLRFARGPPPRTNEDEGFDSLNGNGSSSGDDVASGEGEQGSVANDSTSVVEEPNDVVERKAGNIEKLLRWKIDSQNWDTIKNGAGSPVEVLTPRQEREAVSSPEAETDIHPSETEGSSIFHRPRRTSTGRRSAERTIRFRRTPPILNIPNPSRNGESSYNSSCESDGNPQTPTTSSAYKAAAGGSPLDWTGVTTNSEECTYSSESETDMDENTGFMEMGQEEMFDPYGVSTLFHPSCSPSDKVSCTIWEDGDAKKADLSVLDISAAIIAKVDAMPESTDYLNGGVVTAVVVALLPLLYRVSSESLTEVLHTFQTVTIFDMDTVFDFLTVCSKVIDVILGVTLAEKFVILTAALQRFVMASCFLFLLAVAERTFKQRFLYAKLFSHLTSSRRAKRSDIPHFRLNKVRHIKTWLSVRSYIKKRGPQHSIDCIVSAAFIITLFLVSFLCMALVKESQSIHQSLYNLEVLCWCLVLGVFLLRFMTLGSKVNRKYRSLSVLITEQINLYLQMEQKPVKKEELLLANNVLKLAADLLKELESPFKISGMSANPMLYNLTKIVVLSAVSGVLSEVLGFKLKLHKLKLG